MASLQAVFEGLVHHDGQPDVVARRKQLASLVSSLSHDETRYLSACANNTRFDKDIIVSLPTEIVALIVQHFDLEDYMQARNVSKKWTQALGTSEVSAACLATHFPPLFKQYCDLGEEVRLVEKAKLNSLLVATAASTLKREYGIFESIAAYTYPTWRTRHDVSYVSGRLALRHSDNCIKVIQIASNSTALFMFPNREGIDHWIMTNSHLVASRWNPPKIRAWSLTHQDDEAFEISLPNPCDEVYAYGHHVLIRTQAQKCRDMIWTIGGSVKAVKIPSPSSEPVGPWVWDEARMFVTEFLSSGRLFVVSRAWDSSSSAAYYNRIHILEFYEGKLIRSHTEDFSEEIVLYAADRFSDGKSRFGIGECGSRMSKVLKAFDMGNPSSLCQLEPHVTLTFDFESRQFHTGPQVLKIESTKGYRGLSPIAFVSNPRSWIPFGVDSMGEWGMGVVFKDKQYFVTLLHRGYIVFSFDDTPLPFDDRLLEERTKAELQSHDWNTEVLSRETIHRLRSDDE